MSLQAVGWVLDFSKSSGLEKLVLLYVANFHNLIERAAWPSIVTIAEAAGVSESTVKRSLAALSELGEVEIVERKKKEGTNLSNYYRLPVFEKKRKRDLEEAGKGLPRVPEGFPENGEGFPENRNPVIEPVIYPKEESTSSSLKFPKPVKEMKLKFKKNQQRSFPARQEAPKPPELWESFGKLWKRYTDVLPLSRPDVWQLFTLRVEKFSFKEFEPRLSSWLDQRTGKITNFAALDFLREFELMEESEADDDSDFPRLRAPD